MWKPKESYLETEEILASIGDINEGVKMALELGSEILLKVSHRQPSIAMILNPRIGEHTQGENKR